MHDYIAVYSWPVFPLRVLIYNLLNQGEAPLNDNNASIERENVANMCVSPNAPGEKSWLEVMFPKRAKEFAKLDETAKFFEELAIKMGYCPVSW